MGDATTGELPAAGGDGHGEGLVPVVARRVHVGRRGEAPHDDLVVHEAPLEIRIGDVPIAVVMRTPGDDAELAAGFALTEGILLRPAELVAVEPVGVDGEDARVRLVLAADVTVDVERFRRSLYATSSCGVCGKASIDAVRIAAAHPPPGPVVDDGVLAALPAVLRDAQPSFTATGGLHAAGLFEPDGTLVATREDVGRHNAVDKLVGATAGESWPLGERILLVTGRVSFEIVQKAAVAGIPIVAGISAVSSLAVDLATELGMTLVGFLRHGGFNCYAGPGRIRTARPTALSLPLPSEGR